MGDVPVFPSEEEDRHLELLENTSHIDPQVLHRKHDYAHPPQQVDNVVLLPIPPSAELDKRTVDEPLQDPASVYEVEDEEEDEEEEEEDDDESDGEEADADDGEESEDEVDTEGEDGDHHDEDTLQEHSLSNVGDPHADAGSVGVQQPSPTIRPKTPTPTTTGPPDTASTPPRVGSEPEHKNFEDLKRRLKQRRSSAQSATSAPPPSAPLPPPTSSTAPKEPPVVVKPTEDEIMQEKIDLLGYFRMLKRQYPTLEIPDFTIHSSIDTLRNYKRELLKDTYMNRGLDTNRKLFFLCLYGIEWYMKSLDPIWEGFVLAQINIMHEYDKLLIELGELNLLPRQISSSPLVQIIFLVGCQMAMFYFLKTNPMLSFLSNMNIASLFTGTASAPQSRPTPQPTSSAPPFAGSRMTGPRST